MEHGKKAALLASAILAGCASLTQGTSQTINFSVTPSNATCTVTRDGEGELGSLSRSQRALTVSKDKDDLIVSCQAPGYAEKTQRVRSTTQTEGMMSFLFLDLGITDMVTGAMWAYPAVVSVAMQPLDQAPAAPGSAVASTPQQEASPSKPAPGAQIGPDSFQIERTSEARNCAPQPRAVMTGQGPGFSTYTVSCSSGDMQIWRCEFGSCRVLK